MRRQYIYSKKQKEKLFILFFREIFFLGWRQGSLLRSRVREDRELLPNKFENFKESILQSMSALHAEMWKETTARLSDTEARSAEALSDLNRGFIKIQDRMSGIEKERMQQKEQESPLSTTSDQNFRSFPVQGLSLGGKQTFEETKREEGNIRRGLLQEDDEGASSSNTRRDSTFYRIENDSFEDVKKLTVESDKHQFIRWKVMTLDGFLSFLDEVDLFQKTYNQKISHIFTHFSKSIQQEVAGLLLLHKGRSYTEMREVYKATPSDVYHVTQHLFAPMDLSSFNTMLFEASKPYEVQMRKDDFQRTRTNLYFLKGKFKERHEFLVDATKVTRNENSVPAFTFKTGGLFHTWMLLTPIQLRESFQAHLERQKYSSLEKFFEAYFALVDDTNKRMEQVKVLKGRIKDVSEYQRRAPSDYNRYKTRSEDLRYIHGSDDYYEERVANYDDEPEEAGEDSEDCNAMMDFARTDRRSYSQSSRPPDQRSSWQPRDQQTHSRPYDQRSTWQSRDQPSSSHQFVQSKGICNRLVMNNECLDKSCPFDHSGTRMREERERLKRLWDKPRPDRPMDDVAPTDREVNVQSRMNVKPPPGPPPSRPKTLNAIADDIQRDPCSDYSPDEELSSFNIIEGLLRVYETNQYWKAAHRRAKVKLQGTDEVVSANVITLFDTGASAGNFVSQAFIDAHGLEDFLVVADKTIRIANGTSVEINSKIHLRVSFQLEDGASSADLVFYVMDGLSLDLIIGLPTICLYFKEVLSEMMGKFSQEVPEVCGSSSLNLLRQGEVLDPVLIAEGPIDAWQRPVSSVLSEEDLMIPEPGSGTLTQVMGENYQQACEEFREQLESRVDTGFATATTVVEYLKTTGVDVFVPREWEGIKGIELIKLEFLGEAPRRLKPPGRRIPSAIFDASKREFQRLLTYFYEPSNSSITSPIVVAPKATAPFVRICGDYRQINKMLKVFNFPIPDVIKELHKASSHKVFVDLDMRNAFHNLRLHPYTAEILSVQTPFGQFQPKFLPEGVAPASGILMAVMTDIFADYTEWLIVIWDNILLCATSYEDAFEKLKLVITRCKERNIFLKLSKSWFGFSHAEFFGYFCEQGSYRLTQERIREVTSIPFPSGANKLKKIQQFLGSAVFFKPFIPNYAHKAAALTDMTAKDFNWDQSKWVRDYVGVFEAFKDDIARAFTLYHPNYSLPWFLYVDASDVAVGGVLLQVLSDGVQQVIAFVSKKFTSSSVRWSTIEKEAFSMFYSCMKLRYYLHGKKFTMMTDHTNLLWREASEVPKIVRIRIFLQEFNFDLIHVPGKSNVFADWLSRMHDSTQSLNEEKAMLLNCLMEIEDQDQGSDPVSSVLASVHNARMGHHGAFRTWALLNKFHPGHKIPMNLVKDFVRECAFCQKVRSTANASVPPPTRAIVTDHPRHMCGYDTLYVTPADEEGYQYIHVFKMIPSRLVVLYPSKTLSAESLAAAAFQFFVTYGITDVLITDPGSNITSEVMALLLNWFGVRLRLSLVGRHQSNMVERTHREILRFLSILVNKENLKKIWSKPHVIGIIQFILNSEVSSETGITPFEYTFGSLDSPYFVLPETSPAGTSEYMRSLNRHLALVRDAAREVQESEQRRRLSGDTLNTYSIGDLVLFDEASRGFREQKLKTRFSGPYLITAVHKADVSCKHLVTAKERVFHMENLKPFIGSTSDAYDAARTDDDQHVIKAIVDYLGDPEKRMTMQFLVAFEDEDTVWINYNLDLAQARPFVDYCFSLPELEPLTLSVVEWRVRKGQYNAQGVVGVQPGDSCYVNLKTWGDEYYRSLELPIAEYVVHCAYLKWTSPRRRKIDLRCALFRQTFEWDATAVRLYGMVTQLKDNMVLVDQLFCQTYPKVLG